MPWAIEPPPIALAVVEAPTAEARQILARAPLSFGESRDGHRVQVFAAPSTLQELESLGMEVRILAPDHRRPVALLGGYHDPEAMEAALLGIQETWPDGVRMVDLGWSREGRPLVGLRIGEGSTRVRVCGAHHGNEPISGEVALALASHLAGGDLGDLEVWLVAQVNPDGIVSGSRYNAEWVDLNRNYDWAWSTAEFRSGDSPFSEPETRAMRVLALYGGFGLGLSLHAFAQNFCYVWNHTLEDNPDEALHQAMGLEYASRCSLPEFEVVDGAQWYLSRGDLTDWSYGRLGTLDVTLELSSDGAPPHEELDALFKAHLDALVHFLGQPPTWSGQVVDGESGEPVEAWVLPAGGWMSWSGPDGRFSRWEGDLTSATVGAPGYASVTLDAPQGVPRVSLLPASLWDVRPEPALVPWSLEPVEVDLGDVEGEITLSRPGLEPRAWNAGEGLVTGELEPGPWWLTSVQGTAPRSLWVGERDDRVALSSAARASGTLVLRGRGFGRGSRAWALGGRTRNLVPLAVLSEEEGRLDLDGTPLDALSDPVDVLVLTNGAQLAVLDVNGSPQVDTGAPPSDTGWRDTARGDTASRPLGPGGPCGCGPGGAASSASPLLALLLLLRHRNRLSKRSP